MGTALPAEGTTATLANVKESQKRAKATMSSTTAEIRRQTTKNQVTRSIEFLSVIDGKNAVFRTTNTGAYDRKHQIVEHLKSLNNEERRLRA